MTLEERIERLESELKHTKRQKRLTWGVLVIASVLVVVMVSPQGNIAAQSNVSNEIRTRQIVIVDENGKPRSILAMGKNGPGLALRGENGEIRSSLNTDKEGSRLSIYDEKGEPRIVLVMDIEGPRLGLYDEKGSPRAGLAVGKSGPVLGLFDKNGKEIWSTPETK